MQVSELLHMECAFSRNQYPRPLASRSLILPPHMKNLVIEVHGGVVQEIYSDVEDIRVIVVDWDNYDKSLSESCAGEMNKWPLSHMPAELEEQIHRGIAAV